MMPDTLIPVWVPFVAEAIAALSTLVALLIYVVLFPWTKSGIGRHRFTLYLSVFLALALTLVGAVVGFYKGAFIVSTVVLGGISAVMIWACIQMLRPPKRQQQKQEEKEEPDAYCSGNPPRS